MKYSILYYNDNISSFKFLDEVDEFRFVFNKKDTSFPEFMEKYKDKHMIIGVEDFNDLPLLQEFYNKYKNFTIDITTRYFLTDEAIKEVKKYTIPYMSEEMITSFDSLLGHIKMGVSEVLISNALCFNLEAVSKIAKKHNVKVRLCPNIAQIDPPNEADEKSFFIRPEDIPMYEPYIDICELRGEDNQKLSVLYDVYAHDKRWFGDLKEIITFLDVNIDNRSILPIFTGARLNCKKRCLEGAPCHICENALRLSNTLADNHLLVQQSKD